jgi:GT2 family glycosyltransferase
MDLISIITVNYNQPVVTIEFLNSIKKNSNYSNIEVILVDNGYKEDHKDSFMRAYPELIYVSSEKNLGFAGGNNLGIKHAKGDFFLFLNNDTEISNNLLTELSSELKRNSDIGMISPLIVYAEQPDTIQFAGFTEMNYLTCRNKGIGSMEKNVGQYDNVSRKTFYFHGAAMMCRKSDLDSVGLMEENYFLYYEEFDWCEKFKRAGKMAWFTGKTKIYHKESISVGKVSKIKTYFMTRNRMLFIRRNTSSVNYIFFTLYYLLFACPKQLFKYVVDKRTDLVIWVWRGVTWNFKNACNSKNLGMDL